VYLDNGDWEPGGGDKVVYTDKDGNFAFSALTPGSYNVMHIANNGYFSISPAGGGVIVQVTANAGVDGLMFGDSDHVLGGFGVVHGTVFNDTNGNGIYNVGEPGIADRTLFIDLDKDGVLDEDEPVTQSNAAGLYVLPHVPSGQTRLVQVLPQGWRATNDSTQILNLLPGYTLIRNFGSQRVAGAEESPPQVATVGTMMNASSPSSSPPASEESLLSGDDDILA
jgi:hypothetical protein